MATFTAIEATEAPEEAKSPGRLLVRMHEYEAYVTGVGINEVGRLIPDKNETPRGVALRVSRAAKRLQQNVQTWVVDNTVYFTNSDAVEQPKKTRTRKAKMEIGKSERDA